MSNLPTVQSIYAAFGRGDVPAILALLAEDVEWEYGLSDPGVPWLQRRRGRAGVAKFFESLAALDFTQFEPRAFLDGGTIIVALLDIAITVKATGRTIVEEHEAHIWNFNEQGRVTRFTHKLDTHQHWMAFTDA